MALLIFYLFLALFVSFLCSVMEAVLLSTSLSYLKIREEKGSRSARQFVELKQNIERPLSAILSLNTVAHTVGAAGVGAQATKIFGEVYFGLISAVLTILILVFSEIIPKTIGARYWKGLAMISGKIIRLMIIVTYPLVVLSDFVSRIFTGKDNENTISREEISVLANIGMKEGVFEEKENKILQNLLRLQTVKVTEIMTPRVVVASADENMRLKDFLVNKEYLHYSRIPVYQGREDNITGYVFRQNVFEEYAENNDDVCLKDIAFTITVVNEFQALLDVWEVMLEKKQHIALVVDEYGGMDGIVTMEDIIETLLGLEIVDERDRVIDMQQYARERWGKRKAKYNLLDD